MLGRELKKTGDRSELKLDEHVVKIQKIERIFYILRSNGDIKPGKFSFLPNIASCQPIGKISQNILARSPVRLYYLINH